MTDKKSASPDDDTYETLIENVQKRGLERLGLMTSWAWVDDPKRLAFTLSRYKFVAKMLAGASKVLEVGCGDGFGARVVAQSVGALTCVDNSADFIESARAVASDRFPIAFKAHDILARPVAGKFDAAYSLDVLEHITQDDEGRFITNMIESLTKAGVCIIGMPSLESQLYASKYSRLGHVNCKNQEDFRALMKQYFENVFMFSMNDEVVHTGFDKMSHYNIALCCFRRT